MTDRGLAALEAALTEAHNRWNDVCEGPNGWLPFGPFAAPRILGEKGVYATDGTWFAAGISKIIEENGDLRATFDLRWKADMRAIKRWQAAHPDRPNVELTWPDHADMVVWLLGEVDHLRAALNEARELLGDHGPDLPRTNPKEIEALWTIRAALT